MEQSVSLPICVQIQHESQRKQMQQQEVIFQRLMAASYVAAGSSEKKTGKKIQDAHEAIRPSDITRTPAAH